MEPYFLGVDLGGTQMRMAAVTRRGTLASEVLSVRTGASFAPQDLQRELRRLADEVREGLNAPTLAGLGFGTAGVVTDGPLTQSPHLPRIEGTNVAELARAAVDIP